MTKQPILDAIPLRVARISADPDEGPLMTVSLPATWDDAAARALLDLSMAQEGLTFRDAVTPWLAALSKGSPSAPDDNARSDSILTLLLRRQASPTASFWQGYHDRQAGFVINVAAFCEHGIFDGHAYLAALREICMTLRNIHMRHAHTLNGELPLFELSPEAKASERAATVQVDASMTAVSRHAGTLLLTNLDAALAMTGFEYDSEEGRDAACYLAWLTTSVARQDTGPVPLPPVSCPFPSLAKIGEQIRDEIDHADTSLPSLPLIETAFSVPGPIDCILGVDACGFTPIFSPLTDYGALRESTLARLSYKGYTPETALAAAFAGDAPLKHPAPTAHLAMHRALAGFVDRMPARPDPSLALCPQTHLERGQRRALPHRLNGISRRASIGGQRLYVRTGEYEDGRIGEVTISTARGSSMVKGLLESFNHAVSIGLQYGVPLDAFVDQFAYARYGVGGTVEGESTSRYASSLTDYVFRSLAETYLGTTLPDAGPETDHDDIVSDDPLLPFSRDSQARDKVGQSGSRRLRVV